MAILQKKKGKRMNFTSFDLASDYDRYVSSLQQYATSMIDADTDEDYSEEHMNRRLIDQSKAE